MNKTKKIDYTNKFNKQLKKAPIKIKRAFLKRLQLFLQDQYNPILHYHQLTGSFVALYSFNVTGDWRALFREEDDKIISLRSVHTANFTDRVE